MSCLTRYGRMGFRCDSEQLRVGTMLRGKESWKVQTETNRQFACGFAGLIVRTEAGNLARLKKDRAEVLLARKLPGWYRQRRHGEVESEAVVTPIIKGTLVIESEETA